MSSWFRIRIHGFGFAVSCSEVEHETGKFKSGSLVFLRKLITLKVKISIFRVFSKIYWKSFFSYNIFNGQTSLQMLSDMDQNGMSGRRGSILGSLSFWNPLKCFNNYFRFFLKTQSIYYNFLHINNSSEKKPS